MYPLNRHVVLQPQGGQAMKRKVIMPIVGTFVLMLAGCAGENNPKAAQPAKPTPPASKAESAEEAEIRAALAELSESDRRLAAAQRFCPVSPENRLGAMGVPVKVMIQSQ